MSASANIISFYSFKGGTGRTTALANVAYELAEQGLTVGCMDLDLAAPGLHMVFPNVGPAYGPADKIHDYLRDRDGEIRNTTHRPVICCSSRGISSRRGREIQRK